MLNLSSAGGGVKRGVGPAVCTSAVGEALGRRRIPQGTPAVAGRGWGTGHIRELQPGDTGLTNLKQASSLFGVFFPRVVIVLVRGATLLAKLNPQTFFVP